MGRVRRDIKCAAACRPLEFPYREYQADTTVTDEVPELCTQVINPAVASPIVSSPVGESSPLSRRGRQWFIGTIACLIVGSLIAAVISWYLGVHDWFFPVNFGIVEPGRLFRSGQISRHIIRSTLVNNRIGVIIDLSSRWEDTPDARAERSVAAELGVRRINLTLRGNGLGDPSVYPQALADIVEANRQGKAVLVHCQSGSQRTGGIVAAYRILIEGQSPDAAFAEMRRYGHDRKHNPRLVPFIESHLAMWKDQLAREQIITASQPAGPPR